MSLPWQRKIKQVDTNCSSYCKDNEELEIVSKPDGDKFPWSRVIQYFIGEEQMEKWLPHYADEADSGLDDELEEKTLQPQTANKFRRSDDLK